MKDITNYLGGGGGSIAPFYNESIQAKEYYAGRYYYPAVDMETNLDGAVAMDRIVFLPFIPFKDHIFTAMTVRNTNNMQADKHFRLGIYEDDGTCRPRTLLLDAGEMTLTAAAGNRTIEISQELKANTLYWLAFNADYAAYFSKVGYFLASTIGGGVSKPLFSTYGCVSSTISNMHSLLSMNYTYGPFPTEATGVGGNTSAVPAILMRG